MNYNQGLLFTPEGVRDIYGVDCAKKNKVQNDIHNIMKCYGFKDIQTPGFEFFDIFNRQMGTASSNQMFKFFDRNNNTLVLRPDITPSIARCVAKYYAKEDLQIRLCYVGNTYANNSSYQGRLKEITQVGAELLNDCSSDADAEMIALTIECLQKSGLTEFQVDVGHADFFLGLVEEAGLKDGEVEQLRTLLANKNMFGVEDLLSEKEIDENTKELLVRLPELFGGVEHFDYVKSKTNNPRALKAIERLENLHNILEIYGLDQYAAFDLGMLNHYNYYTGIIFKAYTYGTGEAIATGGRYDHLIEQFGKEASAIGVAIVLDQIMIALQRQKIETPIEDKDIFIVYRSANRASAIELAGHYREQGKSIRLMRKEANHTEEDYLHYAFENGAARILVVQSEDEILSMLPQDGSKKNITKKELLGEQ